MAKRRKHDPTLSRLLSMADLLWPDVSESFQDLNGRARQDLIDALLSADPERIRDLPDDEFDVLCALALAAFHEISLRRQAHINGRSLVTAPDDEHDHLDDSGRLPRHPELVDLWVLLLRWLTPPGQR